MKQTIKVRREGATSFSTGGVEFRSGRDGAIEIPVENLHAALEFGFTPMQGKAKRAADDDAADDSAEGAGE